MLALWFLKRAVSAGTFDRLSSLEARVAAVEKKGADLDVSLTDGRGKFRELFRWMRRHDRSRGDDQEEDDDAIPP